MYSPSKRPVEVADLNQYYASADVNDLTKSPNVYTSLGQMLETEGPTLYISATGSTPVFNGFTNALDFTGFGYTAGLLSSTNTSAASPAIKIELDRGIIGGATSDTLAYWNAAEYEETPTTGIYQYLAKTTINLHTAELTAGSPFLNAPLIVNGSQTLDTFGLGSFYLNDDPLDDRYIEVTYKDVTNAGDTLLLVQGVDYNIDRAAKTIQLLGGSSAGQGAFPNQTSTRIPETSIIDGNNAEVKVHVAAGNRITNRTSVSDLKVVGFEQLPRDGQQVDVGTAQTPALQTNANAVEDSATWLVDSTLAPHYSGNVVFPSNRLERVSSFQAAAANNTAISKSVTGAS